MIQTVGRAALADRLRLLIVSNFGRSSRTLSTITKYVRIGNSLGHTVALFSDPITDMPDVPTSRNTSEFDYLMFVIYETADFPRLPYLAHLLDSVPIERRTVVDCAARYNETIGVEDDLNHPERIDSQSGWEWVDGLSALAKTILQPTMSPLRSQAQVFLFHGFELEAVQRSYGTATEAANAWARKGSNPTKYGIVYVGHDSQSWSRMRSLLQEIEPIRKSIGRIHLPGCPKEHRPMFEMLEHWKFRFGKIVSKDQAVRLLNDAKFCPVINRPLFNHLGIVTNQMFEAFCSDVIPLLTASERND